MTAAPKRRWFRFSLRTMFVVVTVVACWLGWNLHQVRQREKFLSLPRIITFEGSMPSSGLGKSSFALTPGVPFAWKVFGAKHVHCMVLDKNTFDEAEFQRARALFPETDIRYVRVTEITYRHGRSAGFTTVRD